MLHDSIVPTPGMEEAAAQQLAAVRAQNERRLAALVAGHQAELGQVCVCTTQEQSWTANRDSGLSAVRC